MALFAVFFSVMLNASDFSKAASGEAVLLQKGDAKLYCQLCGMNLKQYYKTSHGVYLSDGTVKQYCSMRCLAVDFPAIKSRLEKIVVTDVKSEKLIDVKEAFYVVGSKVQGTMSKVSKLAFANEDDAKAFASENGGEVMGFDEAFARAVKSLRDDADETVKKKQKGVYPMGKKIYDAQCKKEKISIDNFNAINELKALLKRDGLCGELEENELQAVSLYLWEVLGHEAHSHIARIKVDEKEKCPVCGMFVYKYPKWAARLSYDEHSFAFDGVKDLMKFYHKPEKWGKYTKVSDDKMTILVSDYYSGEAISGKEAFYVIGSDIYGPMGKDFIPFKTQKSAEVFAKDHQGKEIVSFKEISEELVYMQDK